MKTPRHGVVVSDWGVRRDVRRLFRTDLHEQIAWSEIDRVYVVSEASLAGADDVFWILVNEDESRGVSVGNSVVLATGLLDRLTALPGFDHQGSTAAVASADAFGCVWTRPQVQVDEN